MYSHEYSVNRNRIDRCGMASVPAICGCAMDAVWKSLEAETGAIRAGSAASEALVLVRSKFEIEDRPILGDMFNIIVISCDNINVTSINNNVLITDIEGEEIGRGTTEWILADQGQKWPVSPEKCLKEFYKLLPEDVISSGLQSSIELDRHGMVHNPGEMTFEVRKTYFDRFLFQARCGEETLCSAALQTS